MGARQPSSRTVRKNVPQQEVPGSLGPESATTGPADGAELAAYIAEITGELASLAGGAKLELVAYFLSMAQVESASIAHRARAYRRSVPET